MSLFKSLIDTPDGALRFFKTVSIGRRYLENLSEEASSFEFDGVDSPIDLETLKSSMYPSLMGKVPKGCEFLPLEDYKDKSILYCAYNVRLWLIDSIIHALDTESFNSIDYSILLPILRLKCSPTLEKYCGQISKHGSKQNYSVFMKGILNLLCKQKETEIGRLETLRPEFNSMMGPGTEELSHLELRFLCGMIAKKGLVRELVDVTDSEFIEDLDVSGFRTHNFLSCTAQEIDQALSPSGILFYKFFVDFDLDNLNESRGSTELILGTRVNSAFGISSPTKIDRITRGYEIKDTLSLPAIENVILKDKIKERVVNLVNWYKSERDAGKKACLRILLRGSPGSGKTTLSQAVAKLVGSNALIVNMSSVTNSKFNFLVETFSERARKGGMVLIFEEAEEMLSKNPFTGSSDRMMKIGFDDYEGIVIFTTNDTSTDKWLSPTEAAERRMDLIVDFEVPGKAHREALLQQEIESWISQGWKIELSKEEVTGIAESVHLSGGFFKQAFKQAASYSNETKQITKENLLASLKYVEEVSQVSKSTPESQIPTIQLSDVVLDKRTSESVRKFLKYAKESKLTLKRSPILPQGATALLSGPPGTGKTLFAQAAANELGLKIRIANASDFLSMWVGGTEKNVKQIFQDCEKNNELLFIDEVEGLFFSREQANKSWEITQINEFLKAVENFKGVLVCATNNPKAIDYAFGRRFLFHINFEIPGQEAREKLWETYLKDTPVDSVTIKQIAQKYELAGGEIRNIAVRVRIDEVYDARTLDDLCKEEERNRTGNKKPPIGIKS